MFASLQSTNQPNPLKLQIKEIWGSQKKVSIVGLHLIYFPLMIIGQIAALDKWYGFGWVIWFIFLS